MVAGAGLPRPEPMGFRIAKAGASGLKATWLILYSCDTETSNYHWAPITGGHDPYLS